MPLGEDPRAVATRGREQLDEDPSGPRRAGLRPDGIDGDRLVGRVQQVRPGEVDDQLAMRVGACAEHLDIVVAERPASRPQPADPERSLRQRLERPAGVGRLLERREELEEVLRLRGRVVEAGDIAADAGDPGGQRLLDVVIGEREVQPRHVVPLAGRRRRHDQVVVADVVRVPVGVDQHQVAKRAHAADRLAKERTERGCRPAVDHIQRVTRPVQDHVGDVGLALGGIQLPAHDHQRARRHADDVAVGQLVRRRSRHGLGRPGNRERQHRDGEHSGWAHGSATFSVATNERGMSAAAAAEAVAQRRPDVRNVQILVLRGRAAMADRPSSSGRSASPGLARGFEVGLRYRHVPRCGRAQLDEKHSARQVEGLVPGARCLMTSRYRTRVRRG